MTIAKIIRHRHKRMYYINDDLKSVDEEVHYKIVFSEPAMLIAFEKWCEKMGGKYDYDKASNVQTGAIPQVRGFEGRQVCWCDVMAYYLVHERGFEFHSTIEPYKGEIYIHHERLHELFPGATGEK